MSKGKTRFGIALYQMFPDRVVDSSLIPQYIKQVESLGYDSIWVQDQTLGNMPSIEPVTLLTYASAFITRVRLGASVIVTPLRNPVLLAKVIASLDHLAKGRLILGIGIGGGSEEHAAFGITSQHLASRFEEGLQLMKWLWSEDSVDFHGRFWSLEKAAIEPKPMQKPHPPIWFGARKEPALRRAVKMGNGWMGAGSSTLSGFKEALGNVRSYLDQAGKDPAGFSISKRLYIAVDKDKESASRKVQEWFGRYYGDASLGPKVTVFGSAEECIEKLSELVEEAPDMIMLNPIYNLPEQADTLAKDIIPNL